MAVEGGTGIIGHQTLAPPPAAAVVPVDHFGQPGQDVRALRAHISAEEESAEADDEAERERKRLRREQGKGKPASKKGGIYKGATGQLVTIREGGAKTIEEALSMFSGPKLNVGQSVKKLLVKLDKNGQSFPDSVSGQCDEYVKLVKGLKKAKTAVKTWTLTSAPTALDAVTSTVQRLKTVGQSLQASRAKLELVAAEKRELGLAAAEESRRKRCLAIGQFLKGNPASLASWLYEAGLLSQNPLQITDQSKKPPVDAPVFDAKLPTLFPAEEYDLPAASEGVASRVQNMQTMLKEEALDKAGGQ